MSRSAPRCPRYREIAETLRAEIAAGDHPPGACLPTEQALTARFGASRFTIRRAIGELRDLGLVEPRAGVGTIVIARHPPERVVQTLGSFEELFQYPAETMRQPLAAQEVTVDGALALRLGCPAGTRWARLRALRLARPSGAPISWLEAHLRPELANVLDLPNPEGQSLLRQIEEVHGLRAEAAQVEMSVTRLDAERARLLKAEEGAPGLVILRRYSDAGGAVYLMTYSVHPENRFSLTFDFRRD